MKNPYKLKNKIIAYDPTKWWGDDFDVRFYLISKVENLRTKRVLDIGGGIGIISSELNRSNDRINLDISLKDLKICTKKRDKEIQNICANMTKIPFRSNSFDCVISASVLQYAKDNDIKNKKAVKNIINKYPSVEESLSEMHRVLKPGGALYLVTPNNSYYQTYMLSYSELKKSINNHFSNYTLSFYNTFPRLSKKYRKLNFANIIPKILSKIVKGEKLTKVLIKKDMGNDQNSVSFYVEAIK